MLISDVARLSGVSAKALRYYEDIGLIEPPERSTSGYRNYDDDVLPRLAFIKSAQAIGLTLGEIRGIIGLREGGQIPCGHVLDLLRARTSDIDRKIEELRTLQGELNRLVARARRLNPQNCDPLRVCHLIGSA